MPAVAAAALGELGQLFQRLEAPAQAFIRITLLALHLIFPEASKPLPLTILCAALPRSGRGYCQTKL